VQRRDDHGVLGADRLGKGLDVGERPEQHA
jgi:hypothetical protein